MSIEALAALTSRFAEPATPVGQLTDTAIRDVQDEIAGAISPRDPDTRVTTTFRYSYAAVRTSE